MQDCETILVLHPHKVLLLSCPFKQTVLISLLMTAWLLQFQLKILDQTKTTIAKLRALHAPLLESAKRSEDDLSQGNKPFASILDIIEKYLEELDNDIQHINYAVLYAYGLKLAVAYESAEALIEKGELPEFDLDALTSTKSVLQLHGPFILSSKDGRDLVTDAERYERTPPEERQFQADVQEFGELLEQRNDLVEEKTAEFISDITKPVNNSSQFERQYLFTKGAAKNLVIVFSAGAVVASTAFIPVVGPVVAASLGLLTLEAMKKSKPFNELSTPIREGLDDLSDIDIERLKKIPREQLDKIRDFVIQNQNLMRRVGGPSREMQWFRDVLGWIDPSNNVNINHDKTKSQRPESDNFDVLGIISVDGSAGSGKTTIARMLADHFDLNFLDTGLLYRATARRLINADATSDDIEAAARAAAAVNLDDLDPEVLMTEIIGQTASKVAALPAVRTALLNFQRRFGKEGKGAVLVGRDIGTVVRPDASHKIFVTASVEQRAKRRCKQLQERGIAAVYERVLEELCQRDARDRSRAVAPLVPAEDAFILDTTDQTIATAFETATEFITKNNLRITDVYKTA